MEFLVASMRVIEAVHVLNLPECFVSVDSIYGIDTKRTMAGLVQKRSKYGNVIGGL